MSASDNHFCADTLRKSDKPVGGELKISGHYMNGWLSWFSSSFLFLNREKKWKMNKHVKASRLSSAYMVIHGGIVCVYYSLRGKEKEKYLSVLNVHGTYV